MGKNKKRKSSLGSIADAISTARNTTLATFAGRETKDGANDVANANEIEKIANGKNNPLYEEQQSFLSSLTRQERDYYFFPLSSSPLFISPERRAEIWTNQAEIGEGLVNRYAWATPTKECLKIFREFSPIVEIGSGSNAYWAKYMKQMGGIDIVAYDRNIKEGGKIIHSEVGANRKNRKQNKSDKRTRYEGDELDPSKLVLRKGGSEVLKFLELRNRTLFLCYPDEEDAPVPSNDSGDENSIEEDQRPLSFGWHCLNEYKGKHVIHVGELAFFDATLNMEQSPWGRSSSSEFQQRLASEFHCIAKIQLPNWLHVRDSISVWKRSEICQMTFVGDEDDESEEIIEYRHIPPEEMLPTSIIAPCMAHLLLLPGSAKEGTSKLEARTIISKDETKQIDEQKIDPIKTIPNQTKMHSTKVTKEGVTRNEANSKKTKTGRRRERQKQKKLLSMQCPSENGNDDRKKNNTSEDKRIRSEYFRLNGRLPLPS
uniref:Uncharacterized protein n=1 Tax=Pseudo-nitzschia australis TaxID=44445 RepID=A0A7S4AD15_9STRA|mmetsp:Transcript_10173/g.21552  ORF Transcript_10173/g.21552 Transcript_10173/m.21552 type:complete len:486 (-) Transcript_10173:1679-3136(-)